MSNRDRAVKFINSMGDEAYEEALMCALLRNETAWRKCADNICKAPNDDRGRPGIENGFSNPKYFCMFMTLKSIRSVDDENEAVFRIPSWNMVKSHFTSSSIWETEPMTSFHSYASEDDMKELYQAMLSKYTSTEIASVEKACIEWMRLTKMRRGAREFDLNGGADSMSSFISQVNQIDQMFGDEDGEQEFFSLGDNKAEDEVERLPLGVPFTTFNEVLGGGLGKKEHIIVCAPTGQGKTIFAAQLAAHVAMSKKHVLFISTEQDHTQNEPRFISCGSKDPGLDKGKYQAIPFRLVVDGVDKAMKENRLNDKQKATVLHMRELLAPYLHMVDWIDGRKNVNDIPSLVQRARKQFGAVDFVVLDWIGAALANGYRGQELREVYYNAATVMKELAISENVAVMSMAQTTKDGFNKKAITENELAECKSLHWQATAAFGISAIRASNLDEIGSEGVETYSNNQYINTFKSRKAKGLIFPIKRDFDYQRFTNM